MKWRPTWAPIPGRFRANGLLERALQPARPPDVASDPGIGFVVRAHAVTAPFAAEPTEAAYFANTPEL